MLVIASGVETVNIFAIFTLLAQPTYLNLESIVGEAIIVRLVGYV